MVDSQYYCMYQQVSILLYFFTFTVAINFTQPVYSAKEDYGKASVGILVTEGVISTRPITVRYCMSLATVDYVERCA